MKLELSENGGAGPTVASPPMPVVSVADAPPPLRFDLPARLFLQLVVVAIGYLAVMGFAFRGGAGIGLFFTIFAVVLVAYYGLPLLLARAGGRDTDAYPQRGAWGIDTASGYLTGRAAWAQVMTVPLLMLGWAVLVAIIA
ncbi:hypothetical protein [Polymorphobacter fuscus]|uniref:Uncharacterized protein n=1 Tax=Sandarakinorhabdus fusca TaxID=1439888 RepID=A0A7C9GPK0_9SPHN|nr:hypothetical protein [Polymorphobacter fuscus]KAB7646366.1 hypothetical protein F9290_10005 [Polymorphobacter fuscus]MQT17595.1 hypothetical protein [Polymorphobacter fuscus]NJC09862.1 hypothetical protein [Polymorphobacter fuscus]